jgi:hypothetical protein
VGNGKSTSVATVRSRTRAPAGSAVSFLMQGLDFRRIGSHSTSTCEPSPHAYTLRRVRQLPWALVEASPLDGSTPRYSPRLQSISCQRTLPACGQRSYSKSLSWSYQTLRSAYASAWLTLRTQFFPEENGGIRSTSTSPTLLQHESYSFPAKLPECLSPVSYLSAN